MVDFDSTKKRALRILGKRNFSEKEMYNRLVGKGEPEDAAEETVKWLAELGYIDDAKYAALIVDHYASKGYGPARVRDELSKRGIPHELWENAMSAPSDDEQDSQHDAAAEYLRKKLRGSDDKDDLRRATDALVRRGFSYDEARDAVNRYLDKL